MANQTVLKGAVKMFEMIVQYSFASGIGILMAAGSSVIKNKCRKTVKELN